MRKGKCAVVKTSTRQTVFLPLIGLVPPEQLKPSDLVGVNKDSYLILDKLPTEFDSRVKAMEVDERPTETYTDIGGLEKQIEELVEAIVLPMEQAEKFKTLGITPPKGCLMYGPPGTSILSNVSPCYTNVVQVPERPFSPVLVPPRRKHATSSLLARPSCKCSSVTAQSWFVMLSTLQRRRPQLSSSLMNLMPLVPSDSTRRRAETVKYSGRCWSSSTSWMVSQVMSVLRQASRASSFDFVLNLHFRLLLLRIVSIFLTLPFSAPED